MMSSYRRILVRIAFGLGITISCATYQTCVVAETAKAPSPQPEVPPKTKMALKMAGLVSFVASSCPGVQPDYARFKSALESLGLSYSDLEKTDLKSTYLSYAMRYKENISGNCARALTDFGPGGKVVADLLKPQGK